MATTILTSLLAVASIVGNVVATPGTVEMKFGRNEPRSRIYKRTSEYSVTLGNEVVDGLYYVNVTVGTPGQLVQLQLDTGSSDVWMFGAAACSEADCLGSYFTPANSTTYTLIDAGAFEIEYVTPGSGVEGDYFSDDITVGSMSLTNVTMALATQASDTDVGIMGIGFADDESIVAEGGSEYVSIIDQMVNQSKIASHSYSLWLDDLEASTGTILFGGYDTAKYQGQMTVLDLQEDPETGVVDAFYVVWSLLALTDSTGTTAIDVDTFPIIAVLDSGTTIMAVPEAVYNSVAGYFQVVYSEDYGPIFPCKYGDWSGTLDFEFGDDSGAIIQVPFSELAIPLTDENGDSYTIKGVDYCSFGMEVTPDAGIYLLGDTFLRSAYVVYDMDAQQVGIAQTVYNATDSDVKAISAGTNLASILPSASRATGTVATTAAAASSAAAGNADSVTAYSAASATAAASTAAGTLSHITGVKTTLALETLSSTPEATADAGSSASSTSASSGSKSSSAAAPALAPPGARGGVLFPLAMALGMLAGGAALFVQL